MEVARYMESAKYMESLGYMEAHTEKNEGSCYRFEKLEFNSSLLDIDATYVIHLENNGRLDNVKLQLNEFQPTKHVYILHNKGYKKCKKDAYIKRAASDLADSYLYIFKDAYDKNYKNILILEDDFIFNEKIKNKIVQQNIMNFINKNNYDIYLLGNLPLIQKAYDNNTNISILGLGTHACIYSRNFINDVLQIDKTKIGDWDMYTILKYTRYMYNEPLCYQLYPETENQKEGSTFLGLKNLSLYIIKKLKLDVQVEPGYTFAYNISKVLYGLSVILLVWLVITVLRI